jgi:hypothetical protein
VFVFGSTDPGEPIAQISRIVALALTLAGARAMTSRARTPARP